jgi:hypothetical protein
LCISVFGTSYSANGAFSVARDFRLMSPEIERWRGDVGAAYQRFRRVPRDRLSWLTVLGDPLIHGLDDPPPTITGHVLEMRRKMISRCKRKLPGIRVRGVFEFDLLHRRQVVAGGHKEAFLMSCGIDPTGMPANARICLPHLHAVVDLRSHTSGNARCEFAAEFSGPWSVDMRPLHGDKAVSTNLKALASYSTKLKAAYSDWHPERSTKFGPPYELQSLQLLEALVHEVSLTDLFFRHGSR